MEVPLPPRFGWIPAFAGLTEIDDSSTWNPLTFLARQRGGPPPLRACNGRLPRHDVRNQGRNGSGTP